MILAQKITIIIINIWKKKFNFTTNSEFNVKVFKRWYFMTKQCNYKSFEISGQKNLKKTNKMHCFMKARIISK